MQPSCVAVNDGRHDDDGGGQYDDDGDGEDDGTRMLPISNL